MENLVAHGASPMLVAIVSPRLMIIGIATIEDHRPALNLKARTRP
jgi:hypothetical protein